jgi:hypothetical protein
MANANETPESDRSMLNALGQALLTPMTPQRLAYSAEQPAGASLQVSLVQVDENDRQYQQQQALDSKIAESGQAPTQTAEGMILSRNDLLNRILGKDQIAEKE